MATMTTTVNVGGDCPATPGTFNVRAHYNEADNGHLFGPFSTREKAEACALTLAGRGNVIKATVEEVQ